LDARLQGEQELHHAEIHCSQNYICYAIVPFNRLSRRFKKR